MKTLLLIAILFVGTGAVSAQTSPPARKDTPKREAPRLDEKHAAPAFVDKDGDGIDDRAAAVGSTKQQAGNDGVGIDTGSGRQRTRKRDRFIDADGDGINDARCGGIGPTLRGGKRNGRAAR